MGIPTLTVGGGYAGGWAGIWKMYFFACTFDLGMFIYCGLNTTDWSGLPCTIFIDWSPGQVTRILPVAISHGWSTRNIFLCLAVFFLVFFSNCIGYRSSIIHGWFLETLRWWEDVFTDILCPIFFLNYTRSIHDHDTRIIRPRPRQTYLLPNLALT